MCSTYWNAPLGDGTHCIMFSRPGVSILQSDCIVPLLCSVRVDWMRIKVAQCRCARLYAMHSSISRIILFDTSGAIKTCTMKKQTEVKSFWAINSALPAGNCNQEDSQDQEAGVDWHDPSSEGQERAVGCSWEVQDTQHKAGKAEPQQPGPNACWCQGWYCYGGGAD